MNKWKPLISKAEWDAVKTLPPGSGPGGKPSSDDDDEVGAGSGMSGRAKWGKKEKGKT